MLAVLAVSMAAVRGNSQGFPPVASRRDFYRDQHAAQQRGCRQPPAATNFGTELGDANQGAWEEAEPPDEPGRLWLAVQQEMTPE